jgi:hypothetical protein
MKSSQQEKQNHVSDRWLPILNRTRYETNLTGLAMFTIVSGNCVPLNVDVFIYSYEAYFMQEFLN